jgi:hypothetical protein
MAIGAASAATNLSSLYANKYELDNPADHPGPKVEEQKKAVGHTSGMTHLQAEVVQDHQPYNASGSTDVQNRTVVGGIVDVRA